MKKLLALLMVVVMWGCQADNPSGTTNTDGTIVSEIPTVPSGITVTPITDTEMSISWDPSTDNIGVARYNIYQTGGLYNNTYVTSGTSYSASSLTAETQYCYTIKAVDDDYNTSPLSQEVCATTKKGPWSTLKGSSTNSITSLVWNGSEILAIEKYTTSNLTWVQQSTNGVDWTREVTTGNYSGGEKTVYANNQYLSLTGSFYYKSNDCISWSLLSFAKFGTNDFTYSDTLALYVSVGDSGQIASSTDGATWTDRNSTIIDNLESVSWLNDRFIAVGAQGAIVSSTDGISWTAATVPATTYTLYSVAYNGKSGVDALYVAAGSVEAYYSTDGINWSLASTSAGLNNDSVWGGGSANIFVAVDFNGNIYSTTDGDIWTQRFVAPHGFEKVVWTGTQFIAAGSFGLIASSADGITWKIVAEGAPMNGVVYDGSQFVAVGGYGIYMISSDANSWNYGYTGSSGDYMYDIDTNGTSYVMVGQQYSVYSNDMVSFYSSGEGGTTTYNSVVSNATHYLKAGYSGVLSWDGATYIGSDPQWESSLSAIPTNDLYYNGSMTIAVGPTGTIQTSPTGLISTWTVQTSNTTNALNAVTQGNGLFVAVGASGTIVTSDDNATTWTVQSSGTTNTLNDILWTGTQYIAVGNSGLILTSADGVTWSAFTQGYKDLFSIAYDGITSVICGKDGTIIKSNP